MYFFFLTFSFFFVFVCMPSICVAFKRPKGLEEGGKEGDEHEEIVHAEEEVKEERTKEKEKGKDSTNVCNKEEKRESGEEERTPGTPEPGKEKEQWDKEDLQKQFSQDDDR